MPMFLRAYYPNATIHAVDIDPDVVHVAKEYFGFREDERLKAHVGDGRAFVENAREPYDIIFLDAFGTRNVPPHLRGPAGRAVGRIGVGEALQALEAVAAAGALEGVDGHWLSGIRDWGSGLVLAAAAN